MADSWRGYGRSALLARARMTLEEQGVADEALDLLDEMEGWNAQSLYQWLLEKDPDFEAEARDHILTSR